MARFALSFSESGEAEYPSDSIDPLAQADLTADAAKLSSIDDFARLFSIDGLPDFAVTDAQSLLTGAADAIGGIARTVTSIGSGRIGFLASVSAFINSISSLMRAPSTLASNFFGLVEGVSALFGTPRDSVRGVMTLRQYGSDVKPFPVTTTTRKRQQQNRSAIIGLVRQAAIIEAARIAPSATYETVDDAHSVLDAIAGDLDSIMEDPTTTDDVFAAMQRMRTAVVQGVPPESVALPNLVTLTPTITVPSLVLAYDTYEDASREAEIVTRNNIRYPGFVPGAEPLRVVSDA